MRRGSALVQLGNAVERSGVTILRGLPRVGRSSLLADWHASRADAKRCQRVEDVRLEPGIFILDHFEDRDVAAIIDLVRSAEDARTRMRLVVAPSNLIAAERLRTTLPGAVEVVDVTPLRVEEIADNVEMQGLDAGPIDGIPMADAPVGNIARHVIRADKLWLRGGFPESLQADTDEASLEWRRRMIDGLLARDYTQWGVERAFSLQDVFRWLANQNGSELDENGCPFAKRQELRSAVHVLELLGLVRRLPIYPAGSSASMGRKQKLFVRDTGLLHALLGIEDLTQLRANHAIGGSFESFATEALILAAEGRCSAQFYREKGDDGEEEIDLVLDFPSQRGRLVAIEFKVGENQRAKRGFYRACEVLAVVDRFVVHAGDASITDEDVHRLDLRSAVSRIAEIAAVG